ncbi:hypothetical protein QTJ16_005071 [Diplocarpon rosae]|uniref:CCHC-type domain-containing protein n=1 Tax=Diplocarpon rosae TaxID=946125 RepID=A0AAD9WE98_9HELO|nr:hypothetical protein QTJ16_005071 [Diplocarpon rosae]
MSWDNVGSDAWAAPVATHASNGGFGDAYAVPQSNDARNYSAGGFDDGGFGAPAGGDAGGGGACYNCGKDGHMKSDCPEPKSAGGCFKCGEEGHSKAECTNPAVAREFNGTCRDCGEPGHRASDCPSKPPPICKNCLEEGHEVVACEKPRKINRDHIPDVPGEVAWEEMRKGAAERDIDDVKEAAAKYFKAVPEVTYLDLEHAFRNMNVPIYLIAIEKELSPTYTNMDLQGNRGKTYSVSWRWSNQPAKPKEIEGWPTPEENLERLADAGEPTDCLMTKCTNCAELGHSKRNCPQDANETERAKVLCYNCDEVGHRVRDCPNPRPDKFACRNCKKSGHGSKECPEPRSAEGVECKKCSEIGHFSRDCPTGGGPRVCFNCGQEGHGKTECTNERVLKCRNCDDEGHLSKECPKPRDYSRVKCQNCDQLGHTKVRCKEPLKIEEGDGGGFGRFGGNVGGADSFGGGGDDFGASAGGDDRFGLESNQPGGGGGGNW